MGLRARWLLWRAGLVYVYGVFVTYLGLGLGLLAFASALGQTHWVSHVAALGAISLGLLALQEALVPEWGVRLGVPASLGTRLHALTARATLPAVFAAGVLEGLRTVPFRAPSTWPCSGCWRARRPSPRSSAYLGLYNALFVLPLVTLLAVAGSRPVFNRLGRWQLHHRRGLKLGLGLSVVALGLLLLAVL